MDAIRPPHFRMPARRFLGFALLQCMAALSPLIILPSLTSRLGVAAWSGIAIGQSVGALGALALNWGWSVVGPARVAGAAERDRAYIYRSSFASRAACAAVALPIVAVIAAAVASGAPIAAALMAIATSLTGLLPTWFFVGTGQPLKIAAFDTIPRFAAAIVSIVALVVWSSALVYPIVLLAFLSVSAALAAKRVGGGWTAPASTIMVVLRENFSITASGLVSSGYTGFAVAIVAIVAPAAVPQFAAASRFRDLGISALNAVTNASIGSIKLQKSGSRVSVDDSIRVAVLINVLFALAAWVGITALVPVVTPLVFSGSVRLDFAQSSLTGLIVALIGCSLSTTFHILLPNGFRGTIAVTGLTASVVGVPLLWVLAGHFGVIGALGAVAIAEFISVGMQVVAIFRSRLVTPGRG